MPDDDSEEVCSCAGSVIRAGKGRFTCGKCGNIFGDLMMKEIEEMEALLRSLSKKGKRRDEWFFTQPRPSVLRRLLTEVRRRRREASRYYENEQSRQSASCTAEEILSEIKSRT